MLSIYIHNNGGGFLDLEPNTQLDIEETMPAYDEDLNTGEYSLPYEGILWTDNNRRLLAHAEQFNLSAPAATFVCSVYNNRFPEIVQGKLTLLGKDGNLNFRKGKFKVTISGGKGVYGTAISNKKLTDLELGGKITWAGMDSRQFAKAHMIDGDYPQYYYLSFAPVAIPDFFDTERSDYSGEMLVYDTANNMLGATFARPRSDNPTLPATEGTEEYKDYRTIPFFQLKYVLKKCFIEYGFTVSGAIVDDAWSNRLFMYNNRAIEQYSSNGYDLTRAIVPAQHMPDVSIKDFLVAVLGLFGAYPVFEVNGEVVLKYRKDKSKSVLSINHISGAKFESEIPEYGITPGYTLSYQPGDDDSWSERVKDISANTIAATVTLASQLATLDIGRMFTTDDLVLVESENMYYRPADATTLPVTLWDAWCEKLHDYVKGDGEEKKSYDITPLCRHTEFDEDDNITTIKNYCSIRQKGSYINNRGALVKNPFGLHLFYVRYDVTFYPKVISHTHNRHTDNTLLETYSLAWNGPAGLAESFHTAWLDAQQKKEEVKLPVLLNSRTLAEIKQAGRLQVNGVQFTLKKIERSIPQRQMATLYLLPV